MTERTRTSTLDRRNFLGSLGAAATSTLLVGQNGSAFAAEAGLLHEGFAIEPRSGVQEVTTVNVGNEYWMFYGERNQLVVRKSKDGGRSWSDPAVQRTAKGVDIPMARNTAHLTLLQWESGKLGIVYGGPITRPGRDGTCLFRSSSDSGKTWSEATAIDPLFAVCRTQAARLLTTGRIVVPVMKWISPFTEGDSEGADKNLTFSWVYISDDEGQTWHRSLSELFVARDLGREGVTHFEETTLEELPDGKLLMLGRTELGRTYQTTSEDGGVSWAHPEPTELASAYAPTTLIRIPATKDLLAVWNQVSVEEIHQGLSRHRLSTAISTDEGATWKHFRNLESLDDRTHIAPPKGKPTIYRMRDYGYRQPDKAKYPHSPGCLRICYATVAFRDNEACITYDYGYGPDEFEKKSATKVKVVSLDWLYGRTT